MKNNSNPNQLNQQLIIPTPHTGTVVATPQKMLMSSMYIRPYRPFLMLTTTHRGLLTLPFPRYARRPMATNASTRCFMASTISTHPIIDK